MRGAFPERPPLWRRYLRFWRPDPAGDTDEELRLHLEARAEELIAQGCTPDSASERALEEFGDVEAVRSQLREIDRRIDRQRLRAEWLASWADDLRYTAQSLARSPGLVATVVAAMSLGLGANAAMFSLLDQLFIRPPAGVASASSLRRLWFERFHGPTAPWTTQSVSYPEFLDAARAAKPDAEVALDREDYAHIGRGAAALEGWVSYVSTNYFDVLGARIGRGRSFSDAEDRPGTPVPVAVLSAAFAQRWFGRGVDPLGRQLVIDGKSVTVIGVAAPGFAGHNLSAVDVWLPMAAKVWNGPPWWLDDPGFNPLTFSTIARLRAGANEHAMQVRITSALRPYERRYESGDTLLVAVTGAINEAPAPGGLPTNRRGFDENLAIAPRLAAVALLVLCIACANVINLLLARAVQRRREIAVRLALGISRTRLVRLMVTESVALAMLGGAAAVLAAYWGGTVLRELVFPRVRWADGVLHWRVVAFSALAALAAGVVTGIVPALRASNPALTAALKSGGREGSPHRSRLRTSLVAAQTALAVVLLVGASLLVSSLRNVQGIAIGYDAPRLLFARMSFDPGASPPSAVTGAAYRRLADELARFPGVESVALSAFAPMRGSRAMTVLVGGDSNPPGLTRAGLLSTNAVSASYFRTVGLRLREGSALQEVGPGKAATTAIVNETMARIAWPGVSALGQCIRFSTRRSPCLTVIGVTEDGHRGRVIEPASPQVYLPLPSFAKDPSVVVVRADPARMPAIIAEATIRLRSLLPSGYPFIDRMVDALDVDYRPFRLGAVLFTAFGALALLVAIMGIYSTVAYGVQQRKHEFGVRIALGARLPDVVRLVIGGELRVVGIGVLLGLGLALAGGRLVASLLYDVSPRDPFAMGFVTAVLLAAAVVASVGPAWRAGTVDPAGVLRED